MSPAAPPSPRSPSGTRPVLRLLPGAAADPGRADRPRGRLRVPRQGDSDRWRGGWDGAILSARRCRPCSGAWRSATSSRGVPLDADHEYVGTFLALLNPFALLGGLATLWLFLAARRGLPGAQDHRRRADPGPRARAADRPRHGAGRRRVPASGPSSPTAPAGRCSRCSPRPAPGRRARARTGAGPRGVGVHVHRGRDRRRHGDPVRLALPGRAAVEHRPGVQPQRRQRRLHPVHADDHDLGRGGLHPDRAALPELDVLGLPAPHRAGDIPATAGLPAGGPPTGRRPTRRGAPAGAGQ